MFSPPDRDEYLGEDYFHGRTGRRRPARPPTYRQLLIQVSPLRRRSLTETCCSYSFGRANARIGTNRSSSGMRNMICASARYRASNSRHRFTNRPADNRGK